MMKLSSHLVWEPCEFPDISKFERKHKLQLLNTQSSKYIILSFCLLFPFLVFIRPVFADTEVFGHITGDTFWTRENSPYFISSTLSIDQNANLFIEPGTTINISPLANIIVLGSLYSQGESSEMILFDGGKGFSIQRGGQAYFQDSIIQNMSMFALLTDGSKFFATSTKILNISGPNIQAYRQTKVYLDKVDIDGGSSFLAIIDSLVSVNNSSFSNSSGYGFELYGGDNTRLNINKSTIENCVKACIYGVRGHATINQSLIQKGEYGIENIFTDLKISNSTIKDNLIESIVSEVPDNQAHAINNFWGNSSGPYHENMNATGTAGIVSGNVEFIPWLDVDLTAVCCSSVIFLPGLEASRLYEKVDDHELRLWEPTRTGFDMYIKELYLDEFGRSLNHNIYTKDIIDEAIVPIVGPNIYKSFIGLMDALKAENTINDWKPMPYDWRLSIDDILSDGKILEEVKDLAENSKTGKVTIISHSNGGLLTKSLMLNMAEENSIDIIDKVILIAVPQLGTPQAVGALIHGFDQSMGLGLVINANTMIELGKNMSGAYGLLPSMRYFDLVTDSIIEFNDRDNIGLYGIFDNFIRDYLNPFLINKSQDFHNQIDLWRPPSNIDLIEIAGWGIDTVRGIKYYKTINKGKPVTSYKPLFVQDGDSTVLVPSALSIGTSTSNISRYWLNLEKYNEDHIINRKHADILEIDVLNKFIENVIKNITASTSPYLSKIPFIASREAKRLRFFLDSPSLSLDIYDDDGNHTGFSTTTNSIEENIHDTYYGQFGDVKYISISAPQSNTSSGHVSPPRVIIKNSGELASFSLVVDEIKGEEVIDSTSFIDIPFTTTTVAQLDVTESVAEIHPIEIDENGDGKVDFIVDPGETFSPIMSVSDNTEPDVSYKSRNSRSSQSHATTSTVFTTTTIMTTIEEPVIKKTFVDSPTSTPSSIKKEVKSLSKPPNNAQTATVFSGATGLGIGGRIYRLFSRILNFLKL